MYERKLALRIRDGARVDELQLQHCSSAIDRRWESIGADHLFATEREDGEQEGMRCLITQSAIDRHWPLDIWKRGV